MASSSCARASSSRHCARARGRRGGGGGARGGCPARCGGRPRRRGPVHPPSPLNVLSLPVPIEPLEFRAIVTRYAQAIGLAAAPRFTYSMPTPRPRLRIGYISSDFGNHPVGHIVSALLGHHDRAAFEITAYATAPDRGSPERQRIQSTVEHFVDLTGLDAATAARRIHADAVDILIDLNGHTEGNRLDVLALRPAPVQATWFGFPGTTGVDFIDYVIADATVIPDADRAAYSEQVVHLPDAYIAAPPHPVTGAVDRKALGLPERGVVLAM